MICFHPRHDLTLARMDSGDIVKVVEEWKRVYIEEGEFLRGSQKGVEGEGEGYVQIFEVSLAYMVLWVQARGDCCRYRKCG